MKIIDRIDCAGVRGAMQEAKRDRASMFPNDGLPRCDCGWLFEICDYPRCPCAPATRDMEESNG